MENSGLSDLFSADARQKFSRTFKPAEFVPKVKAAPIPAEPAKKEKKPKHKKAEAGEEGDKQKISSPIDSKTLFVGNIPITESVKSLTKLFQKYGDVESIRMRSVPIAGAKVDDAGNQDLVRKVCVNSKKFGEQKGSYNAYITFKEESSLSAALEANNTVLGERHLRVDLDKPTLFDHKCTVFLGGIPHYADEEELRAHFAKVLPNGQDDIAGIRLVRDPATLVGKGFGYLLLKDRDAVMKALSLHQEVFKKRWELRVTLCGKRTKRNAPQKSDVNRDGPASAVVVDLKSNNSSKYGEKRSREDDENSNKVKKQKKDINPAMRRINLKNANTKSKFLENRNRTVKVAGKKGKRLGGVVKRALKAQAAAGGGGKPKGKGAKGF